ncbi:MAG: type I-E CRISPR-associated protein Cas7/Cse4/CasC [Planctomycetota bacterium]|nr:type I-E CRISPR-associated protein Cas7/Cse4/CasC [Planctomycetota bacterium]MDA1165291.1 type I-E CRISPR-associated protein Cas7/Cse4/CasC [Planctomycetota bacterium]
MFVELHILQNFAPSNLNRDDTNAPKDCEFGGFRRARISSQCIKRSVRFHPTLRAFEETAPVGLRSKNHQRSLKDELVKLGKPAREADAAATFLFRRVGFKQKQEKTSVLLFMGNDEIRRIAELLIENWDDVIRIADVDQLWEECAERIGGLVAKSDDPRIASRGEAISRLIVDAVAGKKVNGKKLRSLNALTSEQLAPLLEALKNASEDQLLKLDETLNQDDEAESDEEETEKVPEDGRKAFKKLKETAKALKELPEAEVDEDAGDDAGASERIKKAVAKVVKGFRETGSTATDIALFGRMVAEVKKGTMNIDAACQVAHAISTNKVEMEFDFYTAMDDRPEPEESGAGMMGTVEFNSSCFYRYANIDTDQLVENLGGDRELAEQSIAAFVRSSVLAIPTGKQNSMAAQNQPSFVMAVVRDSGLWSLANAFVKPVWPKRDDDLVTASISRLDSFWQQMAENYGESGISDKAVLALSDDGLTSLKTFRVKAGKTESALDILVNRVLACVSESAAEGGQA